jgi:hypothetical protein
VTWFKVDDSFHSHPKVIATDPAALGLWVVAGSWCGSNLTDGFVPEHVLPRLLPGAQKLAIKLVESGLWIKTVDGFLFHDWLDRNPSSEKVKAEREATAERQRKYREARRNASRNASRNGATNAAPTRPDPTPPKGGRGEGGNSARNLHVVDNWCGTCDPTTRHVELNDGRPMRCLRCHRQRKTS